MRMEQSMERVRTLGQVAEEIRMLDRQAQRMVLGYAIEIGNRLIEAKAMLPHGAWGSWLRENLDYSQSSANNFMRVAEAYGAQQLGLFGPEANSQTLGSLSYSKALRLLAVPEEERESFVRENRVEELSTRELDRLLAEKAALEARCNDLEQQTAQAREETESVRRGVELKTASLREEADQLRETVRELEAREPEAEALQAAAAEGEARGLEQGRKETAAELDALRRELEAGKKALKTARTEAAKAEKRAAEAERAAAEKARRAEEAAEGGEAQLQEALEEARAQAERARAEAEQLRRKLKTADGELAAFSAFFEQAQQQLYALAERAAGAEDPDTRAKLGKALRALLQHVEGMLDAQGL